MIQVVVFVCMFIFVSILCGGAFIYDKHHKENGMLMNRNEIIYDESEGIPYGSDDRVSVREEITL